MIEKLKHKYALSEKGANAMVRAFVAVTISNLVLMLPVGLLYQLASYLLENRVPKDKLIFFIIGISVTLLLIVISTSFQYNSTFYSTYVESGVRRRTLAEKLRKLPLSFFGKKDLADLTNTIMSDCALIETASSHWIPELVGAFISTTLIVIGLFFFDWRMALAAVWVMPVAFAIVGYSKTVMGKVHEKTITYKLACLDGIQEGLETIRNSCLEVYERLDLLQQNANRIVLNQSLNNILTILADTLKKNKELFAENKINLIDTAENKEVKVFCDGHYMEEVFQNLILNAVDAMKDQLVGERTITVTTTLYDRQIKIEFKDSGPGISPSVMDNLFEPFISTKSTKHNWGIGLSFVKRIIQSHNGKIEVENSADGGAVFSVYLPIVE